MTPPTLCLALAKGALKATTKPTYQNFLREGGVLPTFIVALAFSAEGTRGNRDQSL